MLEGLDALIEEAMAIWKIPGLAIAVVHEDVPVLVKAFGARDMADGARVTTDTQFMLCSVTKSFTAAGLAMLADEGRLDWNRPVREYLPEFRLHEPVASERATVMDLLCHRTGLPRHDWIHMPGDLSPAGMLAALRHLEPSRDFRERYQYQNLGYLAAGMVAERISGQDWADFTRARITAPLGMTSCSFSAPEFLAASDAARPHVFDLDADVTRPRRYHPIAVTPAGGIAASIADMVPYLRLHLGAGACGETRLLSQEGAALMQRPLIHVATSEFAEIGEQSYGLGLACGSYRGERAVSHDGGWMGWGTRMDMLPERRLGVAVLTNRSPSPVTTMLCHAVFDEVCGKAPVPWLARFRKRRTDFLAARPDARAARRAARRTDAPPSHALAEYAGEYEHPAYGRIAIAAEGDALAWRYRGIEGAFAHRHYDVFDIPETPDVLAPAPLAVTFLYDREGGIDRLAMPLEPMVADIVFRRMPRGEALDPAFRKSCVGKYRLAAQIAEVRLDPGDALTLSLPGQPLYRLLPAQGRGFAIASLAGFSVEFPPAESGAVETIVFHQPDGTYRGERLAEA